MKTLRFILLIFGSLFFGACHEEYDEISLPVAQINVQSSNGELNVTKSTITIGGNGAKRVFHLEILGYYSGESKEVYLEFGFASEMPEINLVNTLSTEEINDYTVHAQYFYNEPYKPKWIELPKEGLSVTLELIEKIGGNYYGSGSFQLNYSHNVEIDFLGRFKNVKILGF